MKRFLSFFIAILLSWIMFTIAPQTASAETIPSNNPCGMMVNQGVSQIGQNMNVMTGGQFSQVHYNQAVNSGGYNVASPEPNTMSIDEIIEYGSGFTQTYPTPSWIRLDQTGSTFSVSGTPPLSDEGKCYLMTVRWRAGGRIYGNSTFGFYVASNKPKPVNRIPAVRHFPQSLTVKEVNLLLTTWPMSLPILMAIALLCEYSKQAPFRKTPNLSPTG